MVIAARNDVAVMAMSVVTREPWATSTGSIANNAIAPTAGHAPNMRHAAAQTSSESRMLSSIAIMRAGIRILSPPFSCTNSAPSRNASALGRKPGAQGSRSGMRRDLPCSGQAASSFSSGGCSGLKAKSSHARCRWPASRWIGSSVVALVLTTCSASCAMNSTTSKLESAKGSKTRPRSRPESRIPVTIAWHSLPALLRHPR